MTAYRVYSIDFILFRCFLARISIRRLVRPSVHPSVGSVRPCVDRWVASMMITMVQYAQVSRLTTVGFLSVVHQPEKKDHLDFSPEASRPTQKSNQKEN